MKRIWITLVVILLLTSPAYSFGSNDLELGLLKTDKTYTDTIRVCKPGFDNNFIVEIDGSKEWLKVTPTEFSLGPDDCQDLEVVLHIPGDAAPGLYEAQVFARGQETMPSSTGGMVGYKLTAKSDVSFMVADASGEIPGIKKEISIQEFNAIPNSALPGEIVKFLIKVQNTGNIKNSFETQLTITTNNKEVETLRMGKLALKPDEIKEVKLLWDTTGTEDGTYEAVSKISHEEGDTSSLTININLGEEEKGSSVKEEPPIEEEEKGSIVKEPQMEESKTWPINPYIIIGALLAVTAIIAIVIIKKR